MAKFDQSTQKIIDQFYGYYFKKLDIIRNGRKIRKYHLIKRDGTGLIMYCHPSSAMHLTTQESKDGKTYFRKMEVHSSNRFLIDADGKSNLIIKIHPKVKYHYNKHKYDDLY